MVLHQCHAVILLYIMREYRKNGLQVHIVLLHVHRQWISVVVVVLFLFFFFGGGGIFSTMELAMK